MIDARKTILVVDDSLDEIAVLEEILRGTYRVLAAMDGDTALSVARGSPQPDLILLDIMMPEIDGYEVCRRLSQNPATEDIPIIFLTAKTGTVNERLGFDLGAEDYITKPPSPTIVLARIKTHLRLKGTRDFLRDKIKYLDDEVERRAREVTLVQDATMIALGSLAESRDNETGNHIRRTQNYAKILAERLSNHPRFKQYLTPLYIERLYKSAPLHDIGKVGIPDNILKKPAKLDPDEFEVMMTHTTIGYNAILAAERSLGSYSSFLSIARDMAWAHHEKWDGSGYPRGLSGDRIPLAGRLMAIPDVYDALISVRVYKQALSHEESVEIIRRGMGVHFDPDITLAFLDIAEWFRDIALSFSDAT
jgi:putative two-component system response regulator